MLELAIWLYHIGTPDLAVRIATDVATALFLLWGILNHYAKKEAEEAFLEVSKEAHYWKMVANHRRDMLDRPGRIYTNGMDQGNRDGWDYYGDCLRRNL